MAKVNLAENLSLFADHWSPRIVGELNGQQVKLAKLKGDFPWHRHAAEDELFLHDGEGSASYETVERPDRDVGRFRHSLRGLHRWGRRRQTRHAD